MPMDDLRYDCSWYCSVPSRWPFVYCLPHYQYIMHDSGSQKEIFSTPWSDMVEIATDGQAEFACMAYEILRRCTHKRSPIFSNYLAVVLQVYTWLPGLLCCWHNDLQLLIATDHCRLMVSTASLKHFCFQIMPCVTQCTWDIFIVVMYVLIHYEIH